MSAALDILGDGRCLLHVGDVLERLAAMAPDSVDCVVTSPPYWGLRDYGVAGQIGLEPTLAEHLDVMVAVFDAVRRVLKPTGTLWLNYGDCYATAPNGRSAADTKAIGTDDRTFRDKPFSTVGPIYVDAYEKTSRVGSGGNKGSLAAAHGGRVVSGGYLKPKDLCMIPNRLAIALQDAGWWVRSEIVWGKSNPMPDSSGTARPATAHEKIFLLTKSGDGDVWRARDTGEISFAPDLAERCPLITRPDVDGPRWMRLGAYYDADEVRQGRASDEDADRAPAGWATDGPHDAKRHNQVRREAAGNKRMARKYEGAANGSGVSAPHKGLQQARDTWRAKQRAADIASPRHAGQINHTNLDATPRGEGRLLRNYEPAADEPDPRVADLTVWRMATKPFGDAHFATFPPELAARCVRAGCPKGGLVLDPFGGAGTTALVALRLMRRAALIELNPDYADMAAARIRRDWMGADERKREIAKARVDRDDMPDAGPLFSHL
ncbi:site-specific DNA-methyltransferase [Stappia sp. WLB 29]|uniref:DNA-methyltransferase n=1 Tax=Stappia sp. WLB 29 TaxID=2925220 RepID=UPI0020C0D826|nr:site-specific DNA-methyltransferase [Stappia sp. WLB 29]